MQLFEEFGGQSTIRATFPAIRRYRRKRFLWECRERWERDWGQLVPMMHLGICNVVARQNGIAGGRVIFVPPVTEVVLGHGRRRRGIGPLVQRSEKGFMNRQRKARLGHPYKAFGQRPDKDRHIKSVANGRGLADKDQYKVLWPASVPERKRVFYNTNQFVLKIILHPGLAIIVGLVNALESEPKP